MIRIIEQLLYVLFLPIGIICAIFGHLLWGIFFLVLTILMKPDK